MDSHLWSPLIKPSVLEGLLSIIASKLELTSTVSYPHEFSEEDNGAALPEPLAR